MTAFMKFLHHKRYENEYQSVYMHATSMDMGIVVSIAEVSTFPADFQMLIDGGYKVIYRFDHCKVTINYGGDKVSELEERRFDVGGMSHVRTTASTFPLLNCARELFFV